MNASLNTRFASLHFTAFYDKQEYFFEYLRGDAVDRIQQRPHERQLLVQQSKIGFISTQGQLMDIECVDEAQKVHVLCVQSSVWRLDAVAVLCTGAPVHGCHNARERGAY